MSVYVDNAAIAYSRMKMSHMIADSTAELLEMADRIKLRRKWLQKPGTRHEHFDVCWAKRRDAIFAGAIPVTQRELVEKLQGRQAEGEGEKT